MRPAELRQKRKMRRRRFFRRRNAHQTLHGQFQVIAAKCDKRRRITWPNAGLLGLFAGVYLDEEAWSAATPIEFVPQGVRELGPIQRMDGVKQLYGFTHLVGLKRAY